MRLPSLPLFSVLLSSTCNLLPVTAQARPDPQQPMVAPVLQQVDSGYVFQTRPLQSADGQRHYQLYIGRPEHRPQATGYPVVYLLDGNAAIGALEGSLLRQLNAEPDAPVIVAIGSSTPLRIDRPGRTLDYTPQVAGIEQVDPTSGLPSGGADRFLDLLDRRIKPLVQGLVPVDGQRQTLWGHSYGGMLVLHALLNRPTEFQRYAAASPSLWWRDGAVLGPLPGLAGRLNGRPAQLLLMRGDAETGGPGAQQSQKPPPGAEMQAALKRLQKVPGLDIQYKTFPGLGHGPMLEASLRHTLLHR